MIDKETYFNLKSEIRLTPYTSIIKLCEEMNLDDEEQRLLLDFYKGKKVIQICMESAMCPNTFTYRLKKLLTKIYNYKNTLK